MKCRQTPGLSVLIIAACEAKYPQHVDKYCIIDFFSVIGYKLKFKIRWFTSLHSLGLGHLPAWEISFSKCILWAGLAAQTRPRPGTQLLCIPTHSRSIKEEPAPNFTADPAASRFQSSLILIGAGSSTGQAALWDVWLRTGSDDAEAPQHWSGSVSDSNSSILHDLVSFQLCGSVGSSAYFTSFSKGMVDSKPLAVSLVTEFKKIMILVSEKQAVSVFFQCFWESKANLSAKNVLLTWGSWQVLHMWELFDCTAYNYINSELSPGSWFMNLHDCDLLF